MKIVENKLIFSVFIILIVLFCGCITKIQGDEELWYYGAEVWIDYGNITISSYEIDKALKKNNLSIEKEGDFVYFSLIKYQKYFDYTYGITGYYFKPENNSLKINNENNYKLMFHIYVINESYTIKESNKIIQQVYQSDKQVITEIVIEILGIMKTQFNLKFKEINYKMMLHYDGD